MLPEQTLKPNDIISQVQGAVPDYIFELHDIKGISAWADKVCVYTHIYNPEDSIRSLDM